MLIAELLVKNHPYQILPCHLFRCVISEPTKFPTPDITTGPFFALFLMGFPLLGWLCMNRFHHISWCLSVHSPDARRGCCCRCLSSWGTGWPWTSWERDLTFLLHNTKASPVRTSLQLKSAETDLQCDTVTDNWQRTKHKQHPENHTDIILLLCKIDQTGLCGTETMNMMRN